MFFLSIAGISATNVPPIGKNGRRSSRTFSTICTSSSTIKFMIGIPAPTSSPLFGKIVDIWPLAARQTKLLVTVWEEAPRQVDVNTLIAGNLPSILNLPVTNIREERERAVDTEGDFIVTDFSPVVEGEVIVDNEDSLFFLSEPAVVGLLPKWLDKVENTSFKYAGVSPWRAPLQWTATTNAAYYGRYIRSAYVIKSGNGSQTATWKVPILSAGQYDVYYYVSKDNELKYNKQAGGEYHFKVEYDEENEDAYIDLKKANEGWEPIGAYYFSSDTVRITLTNECKLRSVTADAVKIVKRY